MRRNVPKAPLLAPQPKAREKLSAAGETGWRKGVHLLQKCSRIISFVPLFRIHVFVLAPLSESSEGVGTIRPLGHVAEVWARSVLCVARGKPF